MADPHTDDLPDRLDAAAARMTAYYWADHRADLRAAAVELRRLRHRDAALTRLLDAVVDTPAELREAAVAVARDGNLSSVQAGRWLTWFDRIAAAVEDIDREHER